jgi:hypothetical protein
MRRPACAVGAEGETYHRKKAGSKGRRTPDRVDVSDSAIRTASYMNVHERTTDRELVGFGN